ncbi:MAG: tRNA(His) guanylyltransferase Thg1 family protein [Treponema sp.]|nr:tRNA(His) guanylyltransferase Thg1 family protein [Treponema sp.]
MSTVKKVLTLGDRMKLYEQALDIKLNPCMHYMLRLDGKNFSKLTRRWPLERPFDEKFNKAMNFAAKSLFSLIPNIQLAWHGSDEISIWFVFPDVGSQFFDGRIQKIVSLAASQASAFFNMKLQQLFDEELELGIFDARIMQFPNEVEVMNCFMFRQRDCVRNSISGYAQHHFSPKELLKKNSDEKIQMMNDINVDFNKTPYWSRLGTFIYKKTFEINVTPDEPYIRSGHISVSYKIENIEEFKKFLNANKQIEKVTEPQWLSIKEEVK